jgi:AAA ATPase domain
VPPFVGRSDALTQLLTASESIMDAGVAEGGSARVPLVLVTGEAGMGKTSLMQRYVAEVAEHGARAVWGTCWEGDQAPALWPWTQVVRTLLDQDHDKDGIGTELAVVLPERAPTEPAAASRDGDEAGRLRVFDAIGRFLARAASRRPTVVLLDDLQWSDRSTVDLMRFLVGMAYPRPPVVVGAYRPGELRGEAGASLAALSEIAQPVPLSGLSPAEVDELVTALAGEPIAARWGAVIAARSQGHPFFARELTSVMAAGGDIAGVPAAIREVVARRLSRLSTDCVRLLEACSVGGPNAQPDVLADVMGGSRGRLPSCSGRRSLAGCSPRRPISTWPVSPHRACDSAMTCTASRSMSPWPGPSGWTCIGGLERRWSGGTDEGPQCSRPSWHGISPHQRP